MEKKSPFVGYTEEEVAAAEAVSFVVQVGHDLFHHNGKFVFSKRSATMYYNKIYDNLVDILENGDEEQKSDAARILQSLYILPLRIN